MQLADVYSQGRGENSAADVERAVELLEHGMRLGIPAAYWRMGAYHEQGLGVNQDISRAWAFYQLAADMGSPVAQTRIGSVLYRRSELGDDPKQNLWANRKVMFEMLECAYSQSYGKAAHELGGFLDRQAQSNNAVNNDAPAQYARALQILHNGVKWGSQDCADYLFTVFDGGEAMANHIKDRARVERYRVISDALYHNPDLRFPNLDKVLPLPPAPLPRWDGNEQRLLDVAKALLPQAKPALKPHAPQLPAGHSLRLPAQRDLYNGLPVDWQLPAGRQVQQAGYWQPMAGDTPLAAPQPFTLGQILSRLPGVPTSASDPASLQWHYRGTAEPLPFGGQHPLVHAGVALAAELPDTTATCTAGQRCPSSGIWLARLPEGHPQAAAFNQWWRQGYFQQGQAMPDANSWLFNTASVSAADLHWQLLQAGNTVEGIGEPVGTGGA